LNVDVQPTMLPGNLPSVAQNHQQPAQKPPRDEQVADTPQQHTHVGVGPARKKAEQKKFLSVVRAHARAADERPWQEFIFKAHPPDVALAANQLAAAGEFDAVKELFEIAEEAA
jgi:hypothetical protein